MMMMMITTIMILSFFIPSLFSHNCLGPNEMLDVNITATLMSGQVVAVQFVTHDKIVVQTDHLRNSIYMSFDGGRSFFEPNLGACCCGSSFSFFVFGFLFLPQQPVFDGKRRKDLFYRWKVQLLAVMYFAIFCVVMGTCGGVLRSRIRKCLCKCRLGMIYPCIRWRSTSLLASLCWVLRSQLSALAPVNLATVRPCCS